MTRSIDEESAAAEAEIAEHESQVCARCGHMRCLHHCLGEPTPCFCECAGFVESRGTFGGVDPRRFSNPSLRRPIDAWPPRTFRGSPGYSARHYAALAGGAEDPLAVAERIRARQVGEEVSAEAAARIATGEDFSAVLDWQGREMTKRNTAAYEELKSSFDAVLRALQSAPQTPGMKRLVRETKRAAGA